MIKIFFIAGLSISLFASCQDTKDPNNKSTGKNTSADKKDENDFTARDVSINASNAYNNIFFDSSKLVQYLSDIKADAETIRRMTSFYNARNYQFAWFTTDGLTEQARGFWNMHNYQTTYGNDTMLVDKKLQSKMENFIAETDSFTVSASDNNVVNTEIKLTHHFIMYNLANFEKGVIKRKSMERFIPAKKTDPIEMADSLVASKRKDIKRYEEVNNSYKLLKEKLGAYLAIYKAGGWPQVSAEAAKLKRGSTSPLVLTLKKRLALTGDMAADTIKVYDSALVNGIKNFQVRYGFTPTGQLNATLIKNMNVPVLDRIKLILLNMSRMQWMITEPEGQLIMVNIPEFILYVKNGAEKVFSMDVVVGKEGHNTMMFNGNLNQVVFSPYWNVPTSIVKKEILPAMNKNPNYLAKHNMEVTGNSGGLPSIRQLPGGNNSLGRVKFLFPNSFDIYFHDTPAKSLFEKDKRAFSHGCIRLSDPVKMANYLLQGQPEWTPEKIEEAMNDGKEKYVKLKTPVPVQIYYYTAWVDDRGLLHFADDIYGHDVKAISKRFTGQLLSRLK